MDFASTIYPAHEAPPPEAPSALRVLLVEDDPFTMTILKKRLLMGGYIIETAADGREGLEKAADFHPDLIISDWMMPEMDGRELCAHIKKRFQGQSIYFILLTAKDKNEDKIAALDTGADEYLVKPCDGRELMARLRAAERIVRLQRELSQSNEKLRQALGRINAELEATSSIQRAMLPLTLPTVPGYGFAAHYQPSTECSGDFYDVLDLGDGRLGLAIGDVSGHGAPAMVAMALTRTLLHLEAPNAADPAEFLTDLNNKMCAYLPTDQYITMFYGVLEPASGRLVYSSAGHNPPLRIDFSRRRFEFMEGCQGYPIKLIGPDMKYEDHQIELAPGERLVLYTDGLLEAFNTKGEAFGTEGLLKAARDAVQMGVGEMQDCILDRLTTFSDGRPLGDDLSIFIVARD